MYFILPNPIFIQLLTDISPTSQDTVGTCNQIIPIPYYIISRLVTLLKVTDAPIQISDILGATVCFKSINFSFNIFSAFFLKCLLASRLTLYGKKLSLINLDRVT